MKTFLLIWILILVPSLGWGALVGSFVGVTAGDNPSSPDPVFLAIDSDEANGGFGYTRHAIRGTTKVSFSYQGLLNNNGWFRVKTVLRDANGGVVSLKGPGGAPVGFSTSSAVWVSGLFPPMETFALWVDPLNTLATEKRFKLDCTLQRADVEAGPYIDQTVVGASVSDDLPVFHFTNLTSPDVPLNVRTAIQGLSWTRSFLVATDPARNSFQVQAQLVLGRYDDFTNARRADNVEIRTDFDLIDTSTGSQIPLENDGVVTTSVNMFSYRNAGGRGLPTISLRTITGNIRPLVQLQSRAKTYELRVRSLHVEIPNQPPVEDDATGIATRRLLHFNGSLQFGSIQTTMTSVTNTPPVGTLGATYVNSTVQLGAFGGEIGIRPDLAFGSGAALNVQLENNGNAVVTAGSEGIVTADGQGGAVGETRGNLQIEFANPRLTSTGAKIDSASLIFPQGLGVVANAAFDPHHAENRWEFADQTLDSNFSVGYLYDEFGPDARMIDESHPLSYGVSDIYVGYEGEIEFMAIYAEHVATSRYAALDQLHANGGLQDPAKMKERLSNDGYLRFVNISSGTWVQVIGATDGSARISVPLETKPGEFAAHFPYEARLEWTNFGSMELVDGVIDYGNLAGTEPVSLGYESACPDDPCSGGAGSVTTVGMTVDDGQFHISPEGGLQASGSTGDTELSWGWRGDGGSPASLTSYTHRTGNFQQARFFMPGYRLTAEENTLLGVAGFADRADELAVGTLLLAGFDSDGSWEMVRPETLNYADGQGDYAGLNYIVQSPGLDGASRIAGQTTDYDYFLVPTASKYYVRRSGVSGRHVAQDGSYASSMGLYGFQFEVTQLQLTYLSNENQLSWFDGSVAVPEPSDFTQAFKGLKLTCTGDIEGEMQLDPSDLGEKQLVYWNSVFQPQTFQFVPVSPPGQGTCYPNRTLVGGITTSVAHVPGALSGRLEFLADGNLGTALTGNPDIDSRLGLPPRIILDGPQGESYSITPVTKLYFTNPDFGDQDPGQAAFACSIDVPYFQDLKAHFLSGANADPNSPVFLAGGWKEGIDTFFNKDGFDASHRGFPAGANRGTYQSPPPSGGNSAWRVRAQQSLFGFVPLDYPLTWSPAARYFRSIPTPPTDLFVLKDVRNQIDYLSPRNAEISFGAQYEGLPQINLTSLAVDAVDSGFGVAKAFTDAGLGTVRDTIDNGVNQLGDLVSDTLETAFDPALSALETEVLGPLYVALRDSYDTARANGQTYNQWVASLETTLHSYISIGAGQTDSVRARLAKLGDSATEATSILHRADAAVVDAILAIDSIAGQLQIKNGIPRLGLPLGGEDELVSGLLFKDGQRFEILNKLIGHLMDEMVIGPIRPQVQGLINEILAAGNDTLDAALDDVEPSLDRVREALGQLRAALVEIHGALESGALVGAQIQGIIQSAVGPTGEVNAMLVRLENQAKMFVSNLASAASFDPTAPLDGVGHLFDQVSKEEFTGYLRGRLNDAIIESNFARQIQFVLRQKIQDVDLAMRSAIDSVFEETNRAMKSLLKDALGAIDEGMGELIGGINEFTGAGGIDGYAHVQGDSLKRLRLDANWRFKVPDDMEFHAWLEILQYDSGDDFEASACLAPGEKLTEVKIGVDDVPLDWISPDLRADVAVKFSMGTTAGGSVYPRGLAGEMNMVGELDFQGFTLTEMAATLGFSVDPSPGSQNSTEAYLGASVRMDIGSYQAAGGFLIGRCCSIAPLLAIDPDVAAIIGTPPFAGGYVYGEVWVPISETLLGIPASCFFNISAGVGAGAFYFVDGPIFGGKMLLGVSGEALCVISIKGEIRLVGLMDAGQLRMRGTGRLTGKAGWCPFCLKFGKDATVTYRAGEWDVDL